MPIVAKIGTEYVLFGAAGLISLLAFCALILVPTIGSFGRTWEKATAILVSIFVLAALLAIGIALGIAIVAIFVFVFSEDTVDAPSIHNGDRSAPTEAPAQP